MGESGDPRERIVELEREWAEAVVASREEGRRLCVLTQLTAAEPA